VFFHGTWQRCRISTPAQIGRMTADFLCYFSVSLLAFASFTFLGTRANNSYVTSSSSRNKLGAVKRDGRGVVCTRNDAAPMDASCWQCRLTFFLFKNKKTCHETLISFFRKKFYREIQQKLEKLEPIFP